MMARRVRELVSGPGSVSRRCSCYAGASRGWPGPRVVRRDLGTPVPPSRRIAAAWYGVDRLPARPGGVSQAPDPWPVRVPSD